MDLPKIIEKLNEEQKKELAYLQNRELSVLRINELIAQINFNHPINFPHCRSNDIYGHGTYRTRRRYKCKSCSKTFNDLTGTAMDGLKKADKFQDYLILMVESMSIRKAAIKLDLNIKTLFDWRHKILSCLSLIKGEEFTGIVERDDKQLCINNKGSRQLERDPYKSPSDRKTKREVSNDKISVMVATDRNNSPMMRIAKVGRIDAESVQKTIVDFVKSENVLCLDPNPSVIKWATKQEIEHHTHIALKHVKNKCYHVQHVNSLENHYEMWIKPLYGVSTKYLSGYLNWFVFIQKIKKLQSQVEDLANCVLKNLNTIKTFTSIEENYEKINIS